MKSLRCVKRAAVMGRTAVWHQRRRCLELPQQKTPMGVSINVSKLSLDTIPMERIRNFSIIAHIDHGKTTLSDAILKRTGVLGAKDAHGATVSSCYLDKLEVEKDRGITVKAQTCTMFIDPTKSTTLSKDYGPEPFMLNLIDTPGHVDFSYEVSRSLASSDGALLLVDATQGVEAQTMANMYLAMERDLPIVPVATKLDAVTDDAHLDRVLAQVEDVTAHLRTEVVFTSGKAQCGVEDLLSAVIDRLPPPKGDRTKPLRCLLFDAWTLVGEQVAVLVRVIDGCIERKDAVWLFHKDKRYEVKEVGVMYPEMSPTPKLCAGQVGYVVLNIKNRSDASIGDTLCKSKDVEPIPGFKTIKPVVFSGVFPSDDTNNRQALRDSIDRLCLNDPSITIEELECETLGRGFQLGFLGMLHMQVFQDRLYQEFDQTVFLTPPQVFYRYLDRQGKEHPLTTYNWKGKHEGATAYLAPYVHVTVVTPRKSFADINSAAMGLFNAEQLDLKPIDGDRLTVYYKMPMGDLTRGFFDAVKRLSSGYATMEYDEPQYVDAELVLLEFVVNKANVSALKQICLKSEVQTVAKRVCGILHDKLERTIVHLPIQAMIGSKIVCRETVPAMRKDVTAKIHAGDATRKQKKLDIQKKAKARLGKRMFGSVSLNQETLMAAMGVTTQNANN